MCDSSTSTNTYMARHATRTKTMYSKNRRVRIIPNEPICNDKSLSSIDESPKYVFSLTSLRHLAQRWIDNLVRLTRKGSKINARNPKTNMASVTSRYPNRLGRYSTIESDTESQKGHLTLVDLDRLKTLPLPFLIDVYIAAFLLNLFENECCR